MLNPELTSTPIIQDNFEYPGTPKRKEDIARQFCAFAKAQILASKSPCLVRDILDSLHASDPVFYDLIKQKCEDYPRIVLSQSKNANFTKFRSVVPKQGVHKRTIYYGLDTETYDPTEWVPFEKSTPNPFDLPILPAIPIVPKYSIGEDHFSSDASEEWRSLIDSVNLFIDSSEKPNPLWTHLLEAISEIDHAVISGRASPNLVKDIIAGDPILSDPAHVISIEKILNHESDFRHQLFSK